VIRRAKLISDYFNFNKLILSNYQVNLAMTYDDNLHKLLDNFKAKFNTVGNISSYSETELRYMRRIMMYKYSRVIPSKIANAKAEAQYVEKCMEILDNLGLGNFVTEIPNNHIECKIFYKLTPDKL
jgi:hypothetical protein